MIFAIVWLDVPAHISRLFGQTYRTITKTKSTNWPPVDGQEVFGDHFGERIEVFSQNTFFLPLRRRSVDPWLKITNPQVTLNTSGATKEAVYTFDVEKLEPVSDQSLSVIVKGSRGQPLGFMSTIPLRDFPKSNSKNETVTLTQRLTMSPMMKVNESAFENFQIYIVASDGEYRVHTKHDDSGLSSGPAWFKVSNTLIYGQVESPLYAREWHENEKEYFLSNPSSELFLTFEEGKLVSTEPFAIQTAEDRRRQYDERLAEQRADYEKRRQDKLAKDLNPDTYYEFGSEWKMLNPAGKQIDMLVPKNTQMFKSQSEVELGNSLTGRITKYVGITKYVTIQVETVKFSEPKVLSDIELAMTIPVDQLIANRSLLNEFSDHKVITDLHITFLGYSTRQLSFVDPADGKKAVDAKFIFDKEFATGIILKYENGFPRNPEKFWDSVMISGRTNK